MRFALLLALLCAFTLHAEDLGLKVAPGFRVTLWADHTLANDIYTMALDDKGRVVVSGKGYVKRLEDTKRTGKADTATLLAEPATGAMGLHFWSGSFAMTANREVARLPLEPNESRKAVHYSALAKLSPGEHGGHAIRVGPDGRTYVIAGNDAGLFSQRGQRNP